MRYQDFIVGLGPETADGIQVKAFCALAGDARGWLRLPCSPGAVAERFAALGSGAGGGRPPGERRHFGAEPTAPAAPDLGWSAQELGTVLFEAVFSGPVRSLLDHSLGSLGRDGAQGLRIKLTLDLDDPLQLELHGLPWELLHKADTGDLLGLSRRTPVVRYLELQRPVPPIPLPEGLRVLVVSPQPHGVPDLDLARECQELESLGRTMSGLDVDFLKPVASLGALRRALLERETHVVHFMGHARFESESGRGQLLLERSHGGVDPVSAKALAAVLKDFPSVQLVVLNACNTARAGAAGAGSPFMSLAPALMQNGLAGVLAMQLPISDAGAIELSQTFYERVVAGDPVDAAAAEARQAIHASQPGSVEWAIPALFLRVPDGAVFKLREDPAEQVLQVCSRSIEQFRVGAYDDAADALRKRLVDDPEQGLPKVVLGIALARGRSLRRLPYQTAQEMHRLFGAALASEDGRAPAAAALLALKVDYFQAGSVREPPPSSVELRTLLEDASLTATEAQLLGCLSLGPRALEVLVEAGIHQGESR